MLTEWLVASLRADVLTALLAYWLVGCCTEAGGAAVNKVHHQARGKHSGAVNRLCSPEGTPYISTQTLADARLSQLNGFPNEPQTDKTENRLPSHISILFTYLWLI